MAETEEKKSPPPLPEGWTRCCTYLEQKRRFCRQQRKGSTKHCGNHGQQSEEERPRVPCPIDPSHQIYKDQVEKHIKVCPKLTREREQEKNPYFRRDVNAGGHGGFGASNSTPSLEWAQQIAIKVLEIHQLHFGNTSKPPKLLSQKDIYESIAMKDLSQPEIDAGLGGAVETFRIKSGGPRHMHQQASLVGHLRLAGVLPSTPQSSSHTDDIEFLEMGAGRGMLGLVAAGVASACGSPKVHLSLVERAGSRSKADTVLRTAANSNEDSPAYMKLKNVQWNRVQCDLAHIHVPTILESETASPIAGEKRKLSEENGKQLVVVAKHLCGAGTDLALKSLCAANKVDVCIMATCCHGVCSWNHYVGRNFLISKFGDAFGSAEFELLRKWSTGTVAVSTNDSDKDSEHQPTIADDDDVRDPYGVTMVVQSLDLNCGIQGLGRACQRLLDAGRCEYMSKVLFNEASHDVDLYHYVESDITPQNAIIVAKKKELSD